MILGVPSGIGDISWLISKIVNAKEWPQIEFHVADGWPYRTDDYLKLLGKKSSYDSFSYEMIMSFEALNPYKTWKDVVDSGFGRVLIQPNSYLEYMHLKDYLPDLDTDYHYPMKLPNIKNKWYYKRLMEGTWIGISAASYRGAKAWKTWDSYNWAVLCRMLLRRNYNIVLLGGSWDDLTRQLMFTLNHPNVLDLVGETTFGEVCSIHKILKYYIGFSSGLGIIRTVLEMPTIILWPNHQTYLSTSWCDPDDLATHRYIPAGYGRPSDVFSVFKFQESLYK